MDEDLDRLAQRYALKRNIKLGERLGFGIHGIVIAVQPDFSEDVLRQWEQEKAEIFGEKWLEVTRILATLQVFGIYLLDINPRNISFLEETQ